MNTVATNHSSSNTSRFGDGQRYDTFPGGRRTRNYTWAPDSASTPRRGLQHADNVQQSATRHGSISTSVTSRKRSFDSERSSPRPAVTTIVIVERPDSLPHSRPPSQAVDSQLLANVESKTQPPRKVERFSESKAVRFDPNPPKVVDLRVGTRGKHKRRLGKHESTRMRKHRRVGSTPKSSATAVSDALASGLALPVPSASTADTTSNTGRKASRFKTRHAPWWYKGMRLSRKARAAVDASSASGLDGLDLARDGYLTLMEEHGRSSHAGESFVNREDLLAQDDLYLTSDSEESDDTDDDLDQQVDEALAGLDFEDRSDESESDSNPDDTVADHQLNLSSTNHLSSVQSSTPLVAKRCTYSPDVCSSGPKSSPPVLSPTYV